MRAREARDMQLQSSVARYQILTSRTPESLPPTLQHMLAAGAWEPEVGSMHACLKRVDRPGHLHKMASATHRPRCASPSTRSGKCRSEARVERIGGRVLTFQSLISNMGRETNKDKRERGMPHESWFVSNGEGRVARDRQHGAPY